MKSLKVTRKELQYEIKIPGGSIEIGPGTVPTSAASVATTIVKEMSSALRKASKEGIFEKEEYKVISS